MDWNARVRAALTTSADAPDEDVIEELAQHARAMYSTARAEGCSHDEADTRVGELIEGWRLEVPALRHKSRPRRITAPPPPPSSSSWFASVIQDARYAARVLWQQPRFALLIVFTMALSIGPTATLFSVVHGVLMKPLPWANADRVVVLKETRGGNAPRFGSLSSTAYVAWREQASTIEDIAAWAPQTFTVTGAGDPARIRMTSATASLFRVLDVWPLIGSLFDEKDEGAAVVVLSEGLWRERFAGDPNVLGRIIQLDGQPRSVVGVVSDTFAYPDRQSRGWVPFRVPLPAGNMLSMFEALAKLRPGATIDQAAAEGTARGRFAAPTGITTLAIFGGDGPVGISARPLRDAITGDVRRPLIVLLVGVALLLAIATSNIASLQLARATTRRRELAIRAALGATGGRVMRQLVVESLLLGGVGGAAGLGVAWLLHRAAPTILPGDFPRVHDVSLDPSVVLFTAIASCAVSVIFGVLPAHRVRRTNLVQSLAENGGSPAGVGGRSGVARSRLLIVTAQVAIACVLLVGASLVGRSFVEMLQADRGYDPSQVLSAPIPMPGPGYPPERRTALLQDVIDRLEARPGIRYVAFTSESPVTPGGSTSSMTLPSRDGTASTVVVQASPRLVSPAYFSTLGLTVVAGRSLERSDTETSQPVVVVNETFARRYLGRQPLGAKTPMGIWGGPVKGDATVVGVVEDVRYVGASVTSLPEMSFSYRQIKVGMRSSIATLLIRGDGDPAAFADAVRSAVREADSSLSPGAIMTLEDRLLSTSLARPRLYAGLLASFAGVALVVTAVGLFGVLSYVVAQRTRELGVRAALGARRSDLVALVVRQGMGVTLAGVVAGLIASAWLTRFIATLLYGVTPTDWPTYLAVPAVLLVVAAAACFEPARRAARLDPLRALRS